METMMIRLLPVLLVLLPLFNENCLTKPPRSGLGGR